MQLLIRLLVSGALSGLGGFGRFGGYRLALIFLLLILGRAVQFGILARLFTQALEQRRLLPEEVLLSVYQGSNGIQRTQSP